MANHASTESMTDSDEPSRGVSPIASVQSVSPRCSPHPCGPPHDDGCLLRDRSPFLASLCSISGGLPGIGRLSQRPAESLETAPNQSGPPRLASCPPLCVTRLLSLGCFVGTRAPGDVRSGFTCSTADDSRPGDLDSLPPKGSLLSTSTALYAPHRGAPRSGWSSRQLVPTPRRLAG